MASEHEHRPVEGSDGIKRCFSRACGKILTVDPRRVPNLLWMDLETLQAMKVERRARMDKEPGPRRR